MCLGVVSIGGFKQKKNQNFLWYGLFCLSVHFGPKSKFKNSVLGRFRLVKKNFWLIKKIKCKIVIYIKLNVFLVLLHIKIIDLIFFL